MNTLRVEKKEFLSEDYRQGWGYWGKRAKLT